MSDANPVQMAEEAGFDLSLIERNFALTPEERADEHQNALDLVWALEAARLARDEESQ